ncbi:Ligand-gated ion channel 50-like [Homarus americanus]|uniref:Ligand-gated ion channel 50-like n=1 Tax=Homarus americanus TaxID=6706 RepID=A0A8J5JR14_HOMAM|nr:Ligand-gated ion channel 50-like [Homarus americanus]
MQCVSERALFFQPDNLPSSEARATIMLDPTSSPPLTNLSVCSWFWIHHFREKTYVYSYATSDKNNNELNMGLKEYVAYIAVGGNYKYGLRNMTYVPGVWYHICFVVQYKKFFVYLDGQLQNTDDITPRNILMNGSLVLGQETDLVQGGYQEQQSFSGIITGFNLYSRGLSKEEVLALARCSSSVDEGDIVAWSSTSWQIEGQVTDFDLPQQEYCTRSSQTTLFPERLTNAAARQWCTNLKTVMSLPRNAEENTRLYQAATPFISVCQPPNHAKGFFWIAATDAAENGKWTDLEVEEWDDINCSDTYKFCFACEEEEVPAVLKMRGLCETDIKSAWFTLHQQGAQRPTFMGFTKYHVYLKEETSTWYLHDQWKNLTLATYYTYDLSYPIGTHQWILTTNYNVCGKPEGAQHELSLSACYDWEYTCGDGTCIKLEQRCDLRVDCPDNTDETGCEKLVLPKGYLSTLTPAGVSLGPLKMNLSLSIQGFSEVHTGGGRLIRMLGVHMCSGRFTKVLGVTDGRVSPPEPDDPSAPTHDEVYEGRSNPLRLSQKVNAPFSCSMNLRNFPFDTQQCHLLLRLTSARLDFLIWQDLNVTYLGEITLYRRFWFYLTSTYLPTIMLMVISYASLYCKRENTDLRVMMSLTTLLVLYALYQQISDGLPRTSYTKAIDVWCFFAITFIFTMVIFHVLVDLTGKISYGLRRRRHVSIPKEVSWSVDEPKPKKGSRSMVAARIIYAIIVFIFLVIYWTVVITNIEY